MSERLNPGSPEAGAKGCKCPVIDNHYGKGIRDDGKMFVIWESCPLHGIDREINPVQPPPLSAAEIAELESEEVADQ